MTTLTQLQRGHCQAQVMALDEAAINERLALLPQWQREGQRIVRSFDFKNYYRTLAFVNALAWIAHTQDHHPELVVTYGGCTVKFDTHSVHGLSENDFICAARVDLLAAQHSQ
jgi:4a-hydroxytetrahydrobiopterin dehydratase